MRIQEILMVALVVAFIAVVGLGDRKSSITVLSPLSPEDMEGVVAVPPERIWVDPETAMEFVWVEGGCYEMGCGPWTGQCHPDEYPVHRVCLDGFWMGRYPVTQSQWLQVMGENPSGFVRGGDYPVESISWHDARELVHKLNARREEGMFRLPTEAEWEYACRSGGRPETYAGAMGPEKVAWHRWNSGNSTQPVGSRLPNGLGLYDMSGNVFEWVQDEYGEDAYTRHEVFNPLRETTLGPAYDPYLALMERYAGVSLRRVIRGGSWQHLPVAARCSHRLGPEAGSRRNTLGVRLVVELAWTPHSGADETIPR